MYVRLISCIGCISRIGLSIVTEGAFAASIRPCQPRPEKSAMVSGVVTGGFGWVQTHPLSKKAPMRFSQIRRLLFEGEGGWGRGGGLG